MNYGYITSKDWLNAAMYAADKVNRLKCNDEFIKKKICKDSEDCLIWKNNKNRMYPKPCKITNIECNTNNDCKNITGAKYCKTFNDKKVCSYCPDDVVSGNCHVATEDLCSKYSSIPYKCKGNSCIFTKDKDKLENTTYLEWRDVRCDKNSPCVNGMACIDGKCYCNSSDDCAGASKCVNNRCEGKQCVLGNFLLREYCEHGISEMFKNKKPPLYYDENKGKCYLTHDFCKSFGIDYNKKECKSDNDCEGDNKCVSTKICDEGDHACISSKKDCNKYNKCYCTGEGSDCKISTGQQVGEFFVGKTIYRWFKSDLECPNELGKKLKEMSMNMNKQLPDSITKMQDPRYFEDKVLIKDKYINDDINLYIIYLKNNKIEIGFNADEVEKHYPNIVKKINNKKFIKISKDQISTDTVLKKIFIILSSSEWIKSNIMEMIKLNTLQKKI